MKRAVLPIVAAVAAILAMISVARTRSKREPTVPPSTPPTSSFEQVVAGVGLSKPTLKTLTSVAPFPAWSRSCT